MQTRIYGQEGHPAKRLFLDNEVKDAQGKTEFMRVHLAWVKQCHDFVPIGPDGKFYLPFRRKGNTIGELPAPWFIGGALQAFMSEEESIRKVLKRETGLDVDPDKGLTYIGCNRYYMNGRAQGGLAHDARCDIYLFPLSREQIASIKLDPKEYADTGLQRYGRREIENILDPFVRPIFLDLWNEHGKEKSWWYGRR